MCKGEPSASGLLPCADAEGANENDAGAANAAAPEQALPVNDDVNAEDDDAPEEDALAVASPAPKLAAAAVSPVHAKRRKKSATAAAPAWVGEPLRLEGGCSYYRCGLSPVLLRQQGILGLAHLCGPSARC